jgi:hypothetical protein
MACVPAKILTQHLPNTRLQVYLYISLLGVTVVAVIIIHILNITTAGYYVCTISVVALVLLPPHKFARPPRFHYRF